MKKKTIWKSWMLLNNEERKALLTDDDMLDCYLDNNNEDIDTYDKEDFEEYVRDCYDEYFDADFGDYGNWKYSPLANQKVAVIGQLGLWNGPHKIYPKEFDNVQDAVRACLQDYNDIYEDQYGNLHVEAHHHDGCNHFIIKKVTDKGLRCLNFRKEVFGA